VYAQPKSQAGTISAGKLSKPSVVVSICTNIANGIKPTSIPMLTYHHRRCTRHASTYRSTSDMSEA
jgi:hypothetical protein